MKIEDIWYSNHPLGLVLAPLSWVFCSVASLRRWAYQVNLLKQHTLSVPVIIVGNITVGGTGKTPLVIWLANYLKKQGYQPGIVSRGYKGQAHRWPQQVRPDSDPHVVGDEAILLASHTDCPIAVAPQRILAVNTLLEKYNCNVIISDDGLQHYAMPRDIEISVLDEVRRYGNRRCLPAGPLREPIRRLKKIDFLVVKGPALRNQFSTAMGANNTKAVSVAEFPMHYNIGLLQHLKYPKLNQTLAEFRGKTVHAVAGIGHPNRFFNRLRDHGLKLRCHEFPDHHAYQESDVVFNDDFPVIMTEKDAVKCRQFATKHHWYLPIEATLPDLFGEQLLRKLKRIQHGQKIT